MWQVYVLVEEEEKENDQEHPKPSEEFHPWEGHLGKTPKPEEWK